MYIPLRVHSSFSLLEGAVKIKPLLKELRSLGLPAVALTDSGNLFGAMEFSLACAEEGIKPIVGCTLNLQLDTGESQLSFSTETTLQNLPLILLVQNQIGYKNLSKLVTQSTLGAGSGPRDPAYISITDLKNLNEGLLALIQTTDSNLLQTLSSFFPGRLYIGIDRRDGSASNEEELLSQAYALDLPLVALNPTFFLNASFHKAHEALLAIAAGTTLHDPNRPQISPSSYLRSPQEMAELFIDLPEALANTLVIAQRCSFRLTEQKPSLPPYETPLGEEAELRKQALKGLQERLKSLNSETAAYYERLEFELQTIIKMGYAGYFLIVADFIQWAKAQGIPVGPGRGSGAGSVVAWALTITDVDPIAMNLIFERFLNPERVSMPDFDIDFCQDRRDEVVDYVAQRYGFDRVARITTFGKLQAKAVVRDVGRVLGLPYGQVNDFSKLIPHNPTHPVSLEEALEQEPDLKRAVERDSDLQHLVSIARELEGLYRHASTHAAGLVIGDRPLEEIVPLYRDPNSAIPVTQFHMKDVEKAGLVKFDLLGLKTLTIIEDTAKIIRARGTPLHISQLPLDDRKTFELLQRVETHGLFQLEGAGMSDVVSRLKPDRFEDLIALVALYRPGPMDDIPRYIASKHGQEQVSYLHPLVEGILKETFGVMVYQEQVMQLAQILAGYTLGGADLLRRAMGKKVKKEMDAQREIFVQGCAQHQISPERANEIFDQVAKFAGYGFNKSHSAPYALLSYQTAYLKANYPAEFFTAVMTHDRTNTDKLQEHVRELARLNIPLLPPDLNTSEALFSPQKTSEGKLGIRYGLSGIKSIGDEAAFLLIEERKRNGPYTNIYDLARRHTTKVANRRLLEKLVPAGVFDTLHPARKPLMDRIDDILAHVKTARTSKKSAPQQASLFGSLETFTPPPIEGAEWDNLERLNQERGAVGFYLTAHPLKEDELWISQAGGTLISNIQSQNIQEIVRLCGVITQIDRRISKSGKPFCFLQLSDPTGLVDVTLFSETLSAARDFLEEGERVVITAQPRWEGETFRLTGLSVAPYETLWENLAHTRTFTIKNSHQLEAFERRTQPYQGKGRTRIQLLFSIPAPPGLSASEHLKVTLELPDLYALSPGWTGE